MSDRLRLGLVGASPNAAWATDSHIPALLANPDVDLVAVCTSQPESAERAREEYGAKLAFHDFREMAASPEIDAVSVVLRVPMHREPTLAAIEAGKHIYTEWPLGKSTAEALELLGAAEAAGVRHMIGLQAHFSPALRYARDLIASGSLGEVLTVNASGFRFQGPAEMTSKFSWRLDALEGQNQLSIQSGHVLDALQFLLGDFVTVRGHVATQTPTIREVDTGHDVEVTAPDHVMLTGHLTSGAVASVQVAAVRWAGSGFRVEVYGREGTMVLTNGVSPQRGQLTRIRLAVGTNELVDVPIPLDYLPLSAYYPAGDPLNVGLAYSAFAAAIREDRAPDPGFEVGVRLHRFLDTIVASSDRTIDLER